MLLRDRWFDLWRRLSGTGDGVSQFSDIVIHYTGRKRAYHNTTHLDECFAEYDEVRHLAQDPEAVELALWYHDLIYRTDGPGSERESACYMEALVELEVDLALVTEAAYHIMATADHARPPRFADTALVLDIDLSILGKPPERFLKFEEQIRAEYAHVADILFREGRRKVLEKFLTAGRIYRTEHFHHKFQSQAFENLTRAIARLS